MVLLAPAPCSVSDFVMVTLSLYVPAATVMVSPAAAALTAAWMDARHPPVPPGVTQLLAAWTVGAPAKVGDVRASRPATPTTRSAARSRRRGIVTSLLSLPIGGRVGHAERGPADPYGQESTDLPD